jgi:DNA-binding NarL/FixJ family response regulator
MLWRLHADLGKASRAVGRRDAAEHEFSSARAIIHDLAESLPEGELRSHFLKQALAGIPTAPAVSPRQAALREFGGLTEREREVAILIAQGKSNREIADALVVTVRTVEAHITRILDKLGFKSRTEIAAWAIVKGLARIPGDSLR